MRIIPKRGRISPSSLAEYTSGTFDSRIPNYMTKEFLKFKKRGECALWRHLVALMVGWVSRRMMAYSTCWLSGWKKLGLSIFATVGN